MLLAVCFIFLLTDKGFKTCVRHSSDECYSLYINSGYALLLLFISSAQSMVVFRHLTYYTSKFWLLTFITHHSLFLESKNYILGEEMWKGPICNVPLGVKGVVALVGCVLLVILFFPMCFFTCLCVKDHVGDVGMMSYCSSDLWKTDKWTKRTRVDWKVVSEHASI